MKFIRFPNSLLIITFSYGNMKDFYNNTSKKEENDLFYVSCNFLPECLCLYKNKNIYYKAFYPTAIIHLQISWQLFIHLVALRIYTKYTKLMAAWKLPILTFLAQPWAGEDLSLKIDEHDQTIWICILEL